MTMTIYASEPIEMKHMHTFNSIIRMPKPAQWNLAKHIRDQARHAWAAADVPRILGRWDFVVYTAVRGGIGAALPDADSGLWVAKRILDGAVDAGVIPDDSPRYVAGVHIHAAAHLDLPAQTRMRASYVGSFEDPRPRRVDIYV